MIRSAAAPLPQSPTRHRSPAAIRRAVRRAVRPIAVRGSLALAAVLAASVLASTPMGAREPTKISLQSSIPSDSHLFQRTGISPVSVGYALYDLETGKLLASKDRDAVFIPASTIKVPTTLMALNILGGDYRFETKVYMTGTIANGVLKGDLYLKGGGDPVLTSDNLITLIEELKRQGITKVKGGFFYDTSFLSTTPMIDPDDDEEASYNPSVGPLSLNFNRVRLSWEKTRRPKGFRSLIESHTYRTDVPISFLRVSLAPRGTRMNKYLVLRNGPKGPLWLLSPNVRRKGKIWLPIKRPAFHAAAVFRILADKNGISLPKPTMKATPKDALVAATHQSVPLSRITIRVLRFSNNMATELIGMVAARKLTNQPQSLRDSALSLAAHMKALAPHVPWAGFDPHNHSGLSTRTRISPDQMIGILQFGRTQRYGATAYRELLRSYHIGRRRYSYPPHVEVQAKTGTIDYVRAISGFLTTRSKRRLAFSLFVSDHRARALHAAAAPNTRYRMPRLRGWMFRAGRLQRAMIRKWIEQY